VIWLVKQGKANLGEIHDLDVKATMSLGSLCHPLGN
jgi:hypothetical protein